MKRQVFGITNTVLTRTLRELENDGLVERTDYMENPPHVIYSLTVYGQTLLPVLHEIKVWADTYLESSFLEGTTTKS